MEFSTAFLPIHVPIGTNSRLQHLPCIKVNLWLLNCRKPLSRLTKINDETALLALWGLHSNYVVNNLWCSVRIFPGWYSWELLAGVCRPVLQILTLFQTKKRHFPHQVLDLASEIHSRFRPGLQEIMSSLLSLERKQNDFLRRKNHTLWGGTYVDDLYTGVPPPEIFAFRQWDNWSCSFDWTTDWWYWFPVVRQKRRQVLKLQPLPD